MNTSITDIAAAFENSMVKTMEATKDCSGDAWNDHPAYAGVKIKKLVDAQECNNAFSSLMVKVKAGCALEEHSHDQQWEMHEVIAGSGISTLGEQTGEYKAGSITIIPQGIEHSVRAGDDGLVLLAKFFG